MKVVRIKGKTRKERDANIRANLAKSKARKEHVFAGIGCHYCDLVLNVVLPCDAGSAAMRMAVTSAGWYVVWQEREAWWCCPDCRLWRRAEMRYTGISRRGEG